MKTKTRGLLGLGLLGMLACAALAACGPRGAAKEPAASSPAPAPPAGAAEAPSPERLQAHVRALSERFVPRDHRHPEQLDRAAAYIRAEFERSGLRTEEQVFEAGGRRYRNVIASLGPAQGERVIVGAHYDAAGELPGADDNASGVAGLLELAALLRDAAPARRVELIAYSLEEAPWFATDGMGSAVHAQSLRRQGVAVTAMLSLEMIGYFSDAPGSQQYPLPQMHALYPPRGDFIGVVGREAEAGLVRRIEAAMRAASPLPVHSIAAPAAVPGIGLSDHSSYWRSGYPAVMVTDTAFYRNPNYHTAGDTADTLDYRRMAEVVRGVGAAVRELAAR
ncbi:M28 family peptidase [Caldimonas tepidiphila]|uniref:M28 family peptidase n=1 Tax=Caldimonas tepidiphila TaxID=2315841 RepID=UPI00196A8DB8|nr:M28 family peptidase [Caldimonas tepidiphila]